MEMTRYGPLSYRTADPPAGRVCHKWPSPDWRPPNDYTPPMNRGAEWRGPSTSYNWPDDTPEQGEENRWYVVIRGPRVGIYRDM